MKATSLVITFLLRSKAISFLYRRFKSIKQNGISLRILCILLLDFSLGHILLYFLSDYRGGFVIPQIANIVVPPLRSLISWLMDAPAGLKLNKVLSGALGNFFLHHIHLWMIFVGGFSPHIQYIYNEFTGILTFAGLGFQISLVQDTFSFVTFHVRCFYTYARRLIICQTTALISLWRLFRGKKYNPLRKRVDSCSSSSDQLFLGTLVFTIALFLYPTTLVYFIVFWALEKSSLAITRLGSYCTNIFDI